MIAEQIGGPKSMLDRARRPAEDMVPEQSPEGYFRCWGARAVQRFVEEKAPGYDALDKAGQNEWFSTLTLQGSMGLHSIEPNERWHQAFYRQLHCLLDGDRSVLDGRATWEMQRILVFAYRDTRDETYLERGRRMMAHFTCAEFCGPEWSGRKGYTYPHILPAGHVKKAFYPPIADEVPAYCCESNIAIHSEALNLRSSQVCCSNVMFPLKVQPALAMRALAPLLPGVRDVEQVEFE